MNRLACAVAIGAIALGTAVFPVSALAGSDTIALQAGAAISARRCHHSRRSISR